ncbi:MAG TPA: DUF2934 domain-containing protein [Alloacidobacterium sp.]|jgi:hypothetical protein|nr:DUF2934 domain-containing protein [Alloacidobacterium sp.]
MAKGSVLKAEAPETAIAATPSEELEARIRQRAHELYEARGGEDGHDIEDWLQAEAEINAG